MIKKKLKKVFSVLALISMFASYVPVAYAGSGDLTVVSTSGLLSVRHPSLLNNIWVGAGTFGAKIEPDNSTTHKVYCVDIHHGLQTGKPHTPDTNVASPEIIWILNNYYPNTTEPSVFGDNTQRKAAAVQLALWYFSDLKKEGKDIATGGSPLDVFNAARTIIAAAENQSGTVAWIPSSITLEPQNSTGYIGETHTVTATVLNQNGTVKGMDQYTIVFTVMGVNSATGTVPIDTNGEAVFSYIGTNPGEDIITASVAYTTPIGLRWIYTDNHQKIIMANEVPGSIRTTSTSQTWNSAVSGYKYHDLNGDGDWDTNEPALENWEIKLMHDGQQVGESELTDENGFYLFKNVAPGTYTVEEVLQSGWTQKESPDQFELTAEEGKTNLNFGNYQKVSITACKQVDEDGDGTGDSFYPDGWEMTLFKGDEQLGESQKTDREGCYTWDDLEPGSYSVTEANPDNWTALGETTHNFGKTLSGEEKTWTFINYENRNIYGYKFEDLNGDGEWNDNEVGLNGWTIHLTRQDGQAPNCAVAGQIYCEYITSDNSSNKPGQYKFINLAPGTYIVEEIIKQGWKQTHPTPTSNGGKYKIVLGKTSSGNNFGNQPIGTITLHKIVDGVADTTWDLDIENYPNYVNGQTQEVVAGKYEISEENKTGYSIADLTCGDQDYGDVTSTDITVNPGDNIVCTFTNTRDTGDLKVFKFEDMNGDGEKQDTELLIEWGIHVKGQNDVLFDNDGYLWENLPTGDYTTSEEPRAGWVPTTAIEQDATVVKGETAEVYFGNFENITLSGYKFNDLDGDGFWDQDDVTTPDVNEQEPALTDWTINLSNGESTKTDENGYYQFADIAPGTYTLTEVIPTNDLGHETWTQTLAPEEVTVEVSGKDIEDLNFGNFKNIDVEVCKYVDENGNGSLDGDQFYLEEGGWEVTLDRTDNEVEGDTRSTINGCFTYLNVGPGNYDVTEGDKEGWVQTYPEENNYNFDAVSGEDQIFNFGNFKPEPDADIDKSSDKEIYEVTEEVTFTVRVYNAGNIEVSGTVTDTLPTGMYFISSNPEAASVNNNIITWDVTLAPNEEQFIEVTVGLDNSLIDQEQLINSVVYEYADPILKETKTVGTNDDILVIVPEEPNGKVLGTVVEPKPEGTVLAATGQPADIMILIGMMLIMPGLAIMLNDRRR